MSVSPCSALYPSADTYPRLQGVRSDPVKRDRVRRSGRGKRGTRVVLQATGRRQTGPAGTVQLQGGEPTCPMMFFFCGYNSYYVVYIKNNHCCVICIVKVSQPVPYYMYLKVFIQEGVVYTVNPYSGFDMPGGLPYTTPLLGYSVEAKHLRHVLLTPG